jgi:hypothetical protein
MQVDLIATLLIQWRKRNLFADDEGFELIVGTIRFGQQNGFRVDLVQRLSSFDPERLRNATADITAKSVNAEIRDRVSTKLISFCLIPSSGHGPVGATLGGAGVAISQSCKHRNIARNYALWITGQECQRTLYVESGGQPASKTAWQDPHANEITNGYFAATLPVLENAWLCPRFAGFEDFQVDASRTVSRFLRFEKSCRETLDTLDELYANSLTGNERLV